MVLRVTEAKSLRSRRADYAALTRRAIIDAARALFAAKGFFFAATVERIAALGDGEAILRATAAGTREAREQWGDVMRTVLATAPHDPRVAESLAAVTASYRQAVLLAAQRLADTRALKPGTSAAAAADILWFYFGHSSYFTLTDENGWSLAQAEKWLLAQASAALLR